MSRYPEVPLGEILTQVRDEVEVEPTETYRPAGIYSFGRGLFARSPIQGSETKYKKFNRLHAGDFVLSKLKGWEGAVAVASQSFAGLHVSSEYPTFRLDPAHISPQYFGRVIGQASFWDQLREGSQGVGARRDRVKIDKLLRTTIPLPTLDEQRRLADWLDSIADRVAAARAARARIAELGSGLSASLLSALEGSAPSVPLGDILTQVRDEVEVVPTETYRPAGIYSFGRGLFTRPPIEGSETKYKKFNRLHAGDFVYSRLFGWEGALAVIDDEFEGRTVSHEFPTFKLDQERVSASYLAMIARWPALWSRLETTGLGLRRQRVPPARLLATEIPLPSLDEQRRLGGVGAKLATVAGAAERTEGLVDALLPAAINQALA